MMEPTTWSENVILVDADYVDNVAFNLTVNFERMLARRIPPADMARWIVCMALDGGMPATPGGTQVVLLHAAAKTQLDNFVPAHFAQELDGKAFDDPHLGEFRISCVPVEGQVDMPTLYGQSLQVLAAEPSIKRLVLVPDMEHYAHEVRPLLPQLQGKEVTLLAMEPQTGRGFTQEILGYSLMSAMGIKGQEFGQAD